MPTWFSTDMSRLWSKVKLYPRIKALLDCMPSDKEGLTSSLECPVESSEESESLVCKHLSLSIGALDLSQYLNASNSHCSLCQTIRRYEREYREYRELLGPLYHPLARVSVTDM